MVATGITVIRIHRKSIHVTPQAMAAMGLQLAAKTAKVIVHRAVAVAAVAATAQRAAQIVVQN